MTDKVHIRLIRTDVKNKVFVKSYITNHVPRIGDDIRVDDATIYTVTKVVWCLDEPDSPFDRVNIGIKRLRIRS